MIPATGILSLENISNALAPSSNATFWGVETAIPAVTGTLCAKVSCASPVPGGISITITSRLSHKTSLSICSIARIIIGPRQMRLCPSS